MLENPTFGRLKAVIARDARGPLLAIQDSVRALRDDDVGPEAVRAAATDIERELARLERIVGDALELHRPLRVEFAPVDVAGLVWDAAEPILGGWEGPHVRLALEPDLGTIVTDAGHLRGVLASLLGSAREAVNAAGRAAGLDGIEIGGRRVASGRLLLWVEDRGRRETGLGVAAARGVVEALGGTIRGESRQGEGARVEIELPANAALTRAA